MVSYKLIAPLCLTLLAACATTAGEGGKAEPNDEFDVEVGPPVMGTGTIDAGIFPFAIGGVLF